MKKFILILFLAMLYGCFGPDKFESSSEESIRESTRKITQDWSIERRDEFNKAIIYFSLGGEDGLKELMNSAILGNLPSADQNAEIADKLGVIDGLTGEEIIAAYRVRLDEDKIKREEKEAERELVRSLKREAQKYLDNKQFEEALTSYSNLAEISSEIEAAEAGIKETTKAISDFSEKMSYIGQIEITEFIARRIDTYSRENVPAIRISVKNNGERSLDEVKVTVYFRDQSGEIIYEDDYHPVLVSDYGFGDNNKPLKAGYVREMAEGKYYTLESPLSEWQDGNATAKIVDLEFSEVNELDSAVASEIESITQPKNSSPATLPAVFNAVETYSKNCAACHSVGVANAPAPGDVDMWAERTSKGMDMVMRNVMNGINAMPAKGLCMTCTQENLEEIVNYMISYE